MDRRSRRFEFTILKQGCGLNARRCTRNFICIHIFDYMYIRTHTMNSAIDLLVYNITGQDERMRMIQIRVYKYKRSKAIFLLLACGAHAQKNFNNFKLNICVRSIYNLIFIRTPADFKDIPSLICLSMSSLSGSLDCDCGETDCKNNK